MSSRIEENLKIISEYLKSLSIISYEDIINMLNDKNNHYQIEFYNKSDILNDTHYSCVSVLKNNNTSELKEYLSADQNVNDIYTKFVLTLRKKESEPIFQIFTNCFGKNQLACSVGENILMFPDNIIDELILDASDYSSKKSDDILCIVGNKELYIPSSLSNTGIKKEKVKDIK